MPSTRIDSTARSGNAAAALMLLLVLIGAGFFAYLYLAAAPTPPTSSPSVGPGGGTGAAPLGGILELEVPTAPDPAAGPRAEGAIEFRGGAEYDQLGKVFDGTGTIAVEVRTAGDAPFPAEWTLHLEPSAFAEGRDRAEPRQQTLSGGERRVEVIDLPMGAYRVYATAEGLSTRPDEVVLHRVEGYDHAAVDYVLVVMTFRGSASVEVSAVRHDGRPAEGLPLHLRKVIGDERRQATVAADGLGRFTDVAPGEWLLYAGDPDHPLATPTRLNVTEGVARAPRITLPPLVDVELLAVDWLERPLAGAEMSGYRKSSGVGALRGTTDATGRLTVRFLAPGPWRFEGRHVELELEGQRDHELAVEGDGRTGAGPDGLQRVTVMLAGR